MSDLAYQLAPEDVDFCQMVVCAGYHDIKYHTLQVVEACLDAGVPGDLAECGVLYGAHPAIMLYALRRRGLRDRKVHLFDSFQGIPRASAEDGEDVRSVYGDSGALESSGIAVSSVDNTIANLQKWGVYDAELVVVHAGWFEEVLEREAATIDQLALLRVDVDLHSATTAVFRHLYDKVVPGGFVISDDYGRHECGPTSCRRAMEAVIGPQPAIEVLAQAETSWWRR